MYQFDILHKNIDLASSKTFKKHVFLAFPISYTLFSFRLRRAKKTLKFTQNAKYRLILKWTLDQGRLRLNLGFKNSRNITPMRRLVWPGGGEKASVTGRRWEG